MIKQYTVENAYTDNERVSRYIDGKLEFYEVMSYWEVEGYCSALESMGYTKAYDVEKYKKELDAAEEEYNWAAKRYSKKQCHQNQKRERKPLLSQYEKA